MELFKIHSNKPDNSKLHVCIKADCLQSCQGKHIKFCKQNTAMLIVLREN